MTVVEAIEEATRRALVAEEEQIDGWWLRCNPALPNRRPNSATTPPHGPVDPSVVGEVIGWYVARSRPPIVRLLSTSDQRIEAHLDDEAWSREAPTRVMMSEHLTALRSDRVGVVSGVEEVADAFVEVRESTDLSVTAARLVHETGRGDNVAYAIAPATGAPVAVGRAEMEDRLVGLYDVVTVPVARRSGWGSEVVRGLVGWAVERGATSAFLQVEEANLPAIRLYENLGFTTLYTYCYRRPPA